jgi:hypothetical protein
MATIHIKNDELVIEMHGMDKVWALRSSLAIPLASIRGVQARPKDAHVENMKGALRVGSYVPGYVLAGYYHLSDGLGPNAHAVFDSLDHAKKAIEAWPEKAGAPRVPGDRDVALEHLARATDAMRRAAEAAGVSPTDTSSGWAFYEVHDPDKTIGLDLGGGKIKRAVIEVQDMTPEAAVALIEGARPKA